MAPDVHVSHLDSAGELDLAARAQTDPAAFARLFDEYMPRVYAFIARRVEDRAAAEELTAATLHRALRAVRAGVLQESSFGGFVYRVAASAIVDRVRRGRRAIPPGLRASDLDEGTDREVAEAIGAEAAARAFAAAVDRNVLRRSFEAIPDAQFRVILVRYFDGLDIAEASAALGCSQRSFAVRVNRALRALSSALNNEATGAA
ncbi:MAG TPA: sigma-70 family RNA polymerase sigma factor [Patescibacteria group bacterium]|jgi:RNA polymerase sigma-70 factor (ECF subfamily)|nr:sigma-70 family RNA polymerase sigma factor [Patescibacteria group bacterium]